MPHNSSFDKEDLASDFRKIVNNYNLITAFLETKPVRQAFGYYQALLPLAGSYSGYTPENAAATFRRVANGLKRASDFWSKPISPHDKPYMTQHYASLEKQAADDCREPLAVINHVEQVLRSASKNTDLEPVTGISASDLLQAANLLQRMCTVMQRFIGDLEFRNQFGNIEIGQRDSHTDSVKMGRQIDRANKATFEQEVLLLGISTILHGHAQDILDRLRALEPAAEREALIGAFNAVAQHMNNYAQHAETDPREAIRKMQPHIPRCISALTKVKDKLNDNEIGSIIDSLLHCVQSLQEPSRTP